MWMAVKMQALMCNASYPCIRIKGPYSGPWAASDVRQGHAVSRSGVRD